MVGGKWLLHEHNDGDESSKQKKQRQDNEATNLSPFVSVESRLSEDDTENEISVVATGQPHRIQ